MNYDVTIAFLTIGVFSLAIAVIHPPEQKTYTITGDGFYSYLEENGAIGVMEAYKVKEHLAPMGKSIAVRYDIPGGEYFAFTEALGRPYEFAYIYYDSSKKPAE
ncbi:hypothetical protein [Pyrococcus kukulkanii]|uniref:hypothetical protein n=1 Tax=Pyrococcus kukulkanii TaxID=1609559 RepID=UPI003568FC3C